MSYTDSEPTTLDAFALEGVWLHLPGQEEATALHLRYGANGRDDALDVMGEPLYFAGRADPVVEYGEHQAYSVGVQLEIPHGPEWADQVRALSSLAESRQVVLLRDNRGRALYATLSAFRCRDVAYGTQVSFVAERTSWATVEVV